MGVLSIKTNENTRTPKDAENIGNRVGTSSDNFLVSKSLSVIEGLQLVHKLSTN